MNKKKYGQNFLINNDIAKKIINLTSIYRQNVLEIGPGNLALSKFIIHNKPKKYIAIEIDKFLFDNFKNFFYENNSEIINEDAMKINEINYFNSEPFIIISNLPFNISSNLLIKWLKIKSNTNLITEMVLMFQKELAERIIAKVNSKNYGRLSILTSAFFKITNVVSVKKNQFFPVPKVDASVLVFKSLEKNKINYNNFKKLESLTFLFFNSRRKKNKKKILSIFNNNQIEKYNLSKYYDLRPENIDPNTYFDLCSIIN